MQGLIHLLLTQALSRGHSLFITHSGLQPVYGSPVYSGRHVQEPAPLRSLQTALLPQGDGWQGSGVSVGIAIQNNKGKLPPFVLALTKIVGKIYLLLL